jgi:hypothetical protein
LFRPDLAAAKRGSEGELVCYTGKARLELRRINHTPFRGTERCVQDPFSHSPTSGLFQNIQVAETEYFEDADLTPLI